MRNANGQQGENERRGKKGEQEHKQQNFLASTSVQITLRAEATFYAVRTSGGKK